VSVELVAPDETFRESWLDARREWGGPTVHQPGSALGVAEQLGLNLDVANDFQRWVRELNEQPHTAPTKSAVPATNWWIIHDTRYLGAIQLRHSLNDFLADLGGHVGYGVRPSERRKGVVSLALRQVLTYAAEEIGLNEVLITCDEMNTGSRRAIESAGGRLRSVRDADQLSRDLGHVGNTRRYWVPTISRASR
jgi:predicted acetyltransferase